MSRRYALAGVLSCLGGALFGCQAVLSFDREDRPLPADAAVDVPPLDVGTGDAGVDAPAPVVDAGTFMCSPSESTRCSNLETCCYVTAQRPNYCVATPQSCDLGTFPISCNSAAHCAARGRVGEVCCGKPEGSYYASIDCMPEADCTAAFRKICRTSGDCPDGGTCHIEHTILGSCE